MTDVIRVGVSGAGGRVGTELLNLIRLDPNFIPSCGVGNKSSGFEQNLVSFNQIIPSSIDILIDFSTPEMLEGALNYCLENKIPLVSGTTGFSDKIHERLLNAGFQIPVLWSPNMSLGIAVMKNALKVFKATKNFDYQIEEWHHRLKKDCPSGTAILLQNELEKNIEKKCPPILALRGGGIFGVHKIYAISDEEIIQFEHTAINRTVFARGAIVAARWLLSKKAGLYSMDDVIEN